MAVDLEWQDAESILVLRYSGVFDWQEHLDKEQDLRIILDAASKRVDFIIDANDLVIPADMLKRLRQLVGSYLFEHPRAGVTVVIVSSTLVRTVAEMLAALSPAAKTRILYAPNRDEAQRTITEARKEAGGAE